MRRDHELIRKLILYVEEHDEMDTHRHLADFPGYDERTIARHIELLEEDGLVEANLLRIEQPPGPVSGAVTRLRSKGHDFAENVTNDAVWKKVQALVTAKGGSVSLAIVIELAKQAARKHLSQ